MIRTTRVCLFGKNYYNIPIFTQRAATLPKQIFVEFSILTDKEEESASKKSKQILLQRVKTNIPRESLNDSYHEIKYDVLRDVFTDGVRKNPVLFQRDSALKEFFNSLPAFTPPEIIKVFKVLSEANKRPVLSLKALCSLLIAQSNWKYSSKECADLLYCLAKLSYRDQNLMKLIADHLKNFETFHTAKAASYILFSLGDLKYRDCELIEKLLKYVVRFNHPTKISLNCLRAVSLLNYSSPEVDYLMTTLGKLNETDFVQSTDFINFVWFSVILNKEHLIDPKHISRVLSEKYVSRLLNNGIHASVKWKLLNINGAARQMPSYYGPVLNNQSVYKILSLSIPNQRSNFLESVLDVLSHIFPQSGCVKPLVNTGVGFYLDLEFSKPEKDAFGVKEEESGNKKLGIVLLNFNDICSDNTLSGIAAFKLRILERMGYELVLLRHFEYCHSDPLSKKIEFIRNKIQNSATSSKNLDHEKLLESEQK